MATNLVGGLIPEDMMVEVLLRIPSRSLMRLRCVCKSWSDLIIQPQFAANHFNRRGNQQPLILFSGFKQFFKLKFVSFFRFNQYQPFTTLFEIDCMAPRKPSMSINFPDFFKEMVVAGSINGIICLSSYHSSTAYRSLVLWNPTINKWKPIPIPARQYKYSVGLGFDSVTNDYKIIILFYAPGGMGTLCGSQIQIYSANQDMWEEVAEGDIIPFRPQNPNCSVIVKGVPYWTSDNKKQIHLHCEEVIGAFDPHTGLFKGVGYPVHVKNEKTSVHIFNFMESLAVLIYSPGENPSNIVDVYALDETHSAWRKTFTTALTNLPIVDNICIQQCFEEAGDIIVVWRKERNDRTTFFYDLRTNCVLDSVAAIGIDACHPWWVESYRHLESLICIRGMEPLGDKVENDKEQEGTSNRTGRYYVGRPRFM